MYIIINPNINYKIKYIKCIFSANDIAKQRTKRMEKHGAISRTAVISRVNKSENALNEGKIASQITYGRSTILCH